MTKRWTKEEVDYLIKNYQSMNLEDIKKELGRETRAIWIKASRLGLKKNDNIVDLEFFNNIDTEEKAYWLGFIYADGYVCKNNYGYEFGIELSTVDIGHLEKLKNSLNSNYNITSRTRNTGVKVSSFRVYRKDFVESLLSNGVSYNKTFSMQMPKLQNDLMKHFIRGYFDGDGFVMMRKRNTYGYDIRTGFVSGSKLFVEQIVDYLNKELILKNGRYIRVENESNYYFETTNRKDALTVLNYLYKDANFYLDRKYEKYLSILRFTKDKIA